MTTGSLVRRTLGLAAVGLLAAVGVRGWLAGQELAAAEQRLPALREAVRAGELERGQRELTGLQRETRAAHRLTSGPDWWLATHVPYLGRTPARAAALAATADELSRHVAPQLLSLADQLAPHRLHGGRGVPLDLNAVRRAQPTVDEALHRVLRLRARLPGRDAGVAGPVADAGQRMDEQLGELAAALRTASTATRVLPAMLGADGPRRYLVVFQTNAEARGTGGLGGAYGVLEATRGQLRFARMASNRDLIQLPAARIDLGPDFRALYGDDATLFQNANLSPHFPYAAQLWSDMWVQRYGEQLDGVMATDPIALAAVLRALGPVTMAGGEQVTARNVVALTESEAYARFRDSEERKAFLVTIARTVADRLLTADAQDLRRLRATFGPVVSEGRLVVYSRHADEQSLLASTRVGGTVAVTRAPYAHVVVNNAGANKLDYYLAREVEYELGSCNGGRRSSVIRVRLTNSAPSTGLPVYVAGRNGRSHAPSNRLILSLYATTGAQLTSLTADGRPVPVLVGRERGHPTFLVTLEVPAGRTRVLEYRLDEPRSADPPRVPVQPLVLPQRTTVTAPSCPPT